MGVKWESLDVFGLHKEFRERFIMLCNWREWGGDVRRSNILACLETLLPDTFITVKAVTWLGSQQLHKHYSRYNAISLVRFLGLPRCKSATWWISPNVHCLNSWFLGAYTNKQIGAWHVCLNSTGPDSSPHIGPDSDWIISEIHIGLGQGSKFQVWVRQARSAWYPE